MNDTKQGFGGRRMRRILVALAAFTCARCSVRRRRRRRQRRRGHHDDGGRHARPRRAPTCRRSMRTVTVRSASASPPLVLATTGPTTRRSSTRRRVLRGERLRRGDRGRQHRGRGRRDRAREPRPAADRHHGRRRQRDRRADARPGEEVRRHVLVLQLRCRVPGGPDYLQSTDNGAGIAYTAGVATGILLRDSGGDAITMIGCCDLGFEIQHYSSFQLGLAAVDPALKFTYVQSGDFQFDFDNVQNARRRTRTRSPRARTPSTRTSVVRTSRS